jgi:hypothetical protein
MESEHVVAPVRVMKLYVGTSLRNNLPALSLKSPENDPGFGAGPLTQADTGRIRMKIESGILLDFSTSSAMA